jgi:hypothetical protein
MGAGFKAKGVSMCPLAQDHQAAWVGGFKAKGTALCVHGWIHEP